MVTFCQKVLKNHQKKFEVSSIKNDKNSSFLVKIGKKWDLQKKWFVPQWSKLLKQLDYKLISLKNEILNYMVA